MADLSHEVSRPPLVPPGQYVGTDTWLDRTGRYWHKRADGSLRIYRVGAGGRLYDEHTVSQAVVRMALHHPAMRIPHHGIGRVYPSESPQQPQKCSSRSTSLDTVRIIWRGRDPAERRQDAADWRRRRQIVAALRVATSEHLRRRHRYAEQRMSGCGVVRGQQQCARPSCGHKSGIQRYRCDIWQLCPYCARVHSRRRTSDLRDALDRHHYRVRAPGCTWHLVTLTVRTVGHYGEAVDTISRHVAALWRDVLTWRYTQVDAPTRVDDRGRLWYGRQRVLGGSDGTYWLRRDRERRCGAFRSIEFGDRTGNAHVHMLAYTPWVPQQVISQAWLEMTGSRVVDVRAVGERGRVARERLRGRAGWVDSDGAIREVTKYVSKTWTSDPVRAVELWDALAGHHVTQIYGSLRGLLRREGELFFTCPECGGHQYIWIGVPYDVALDLHRRGPP